jgi:hypothetical protein
MSALFKLVEPWLSDSENDDLIKLNDHLVWLQKELFYEYEPNLFEAFDDRLFAWLQNVNDGDDRKSLFRLLEHLFFIGKQQFDSLCRAAYGDAVTRWVVDQADLDVADPVLSQTISNLMQNTWFCPITDSMRINGFLKLNGLRGHDYRPDWRSLQEFADKKRLEDYMTTTGIQRLILLEDFVGSGQQMKSTVAWAAAAFPALPIMVVPLVCCPTGIMTGSELEKSYQNVTFSATLTLKPELFLREQAQVNEPEIFTRVREIILRVKSRLDNWQSKPFGFEGTGALVALYSNCPDNTLPIIHHRGDHWTPLFFRIRRS